MEDTIAADPGPRRAPADARVIAVGAGPLGPPLALLLARAGIRVLLLERQRDFAREFRGEVVLPTGRDVLEQMGLGEAVEALPRSEPNRFMLYVNRKLVIEAELDPEFLGGKPMAISQPALLERLIAEGGKHPSFEFRRGASVKEVLRTEGRATGVRVRSEDGETEIPARLVIGTDGRSSVVRRDSGIEIHADRVPMDIVWCKFPPLDDPSLAAPETPWVRAYVGGGHLLIAYVSFDGQIQVAWVIFKGSFGELRRRGLPEWIEEMAKHASPELAAHFRRYADQVSHPFLLDTASDRVLSWSAPGLLLLGDAAHTMSPVGGQGINVGLRDVLVAANHLVPALRAGDADRVQAACRAIEAERVGEVQRIQRLQALPPKVILGTAWWARVVRRLVPHLVQRSFVQREALERFGVFFRGDGPVRLEI